MATLTRFACDRCDTKTEEAPAPTQAGGCFGGHDHGIPVGWVALMASFGQPEVDAAALEKEIEALDADIDPLLGPDDLGLDHVHVLLCPACAETIPVSFLRATAKARSEAHGTHGILGRPLLRNREGRLARKLAAIRRLGAPFA